MAQPLLVLDTNVVLDWLVFEDGGAPELIRAIKENTVVIATNDDIVNELKRVLGYPAFALTPQAQEKALATYLARTTTHHARKTLRELVPRCRDGDDQKFLDLAAYTGADALFSKDNAVLRAKKAMKSRFNCAVLKPLESARWLTDWREPNAQTPRPAS